MTVHLACAAQFRKLLTSGMTGGPLGVLWGPSRPLGRGLSGQVQLGMHLAHMLPPAPYCHCFPQVHVNSRKITE